METTTKRQNKYEYLYVIQGDYGAGWEDLTQSTCWREVKINLKAYLIDEGGTYRIIKRRERRN